MKIKSIIKGVFVFSLLFFGLFGNAEAYVNGFNPATTPVSSLVGIVASCYKSGNYQHYYMKLENTTLGKTYYQSIECGDYYSGPRINRTMLDYVPAGDYGDFKLSLTGWYSPEYYYLTYSQPSSPSRESLLRRFFRFVFRR